MPRLKYDVHFYVEDGFLVRGTMDPHAALEIAVADDDEFERRYWAAEDAIRCPFYDTHDDGCPHCDSDPTSQQVAALADLCHELIQNARPGLRRIVPAPRNCDDYRWFVWEADTRGRGVFESVEFR